ncbi:EcoAI/FtnUII family type I restriction enzme subunit R [Gracilimonas amylolytica]|uniref:EcoAI/FtnUII family type I restriction enzme subunit R n=1 Tax=Gracilimonas amylolytica TaxID=1749045 RepID=UPI000CD9EA6F|nr:DEAD/DEAH box helicase family protein [Gracilimonas amylolytica]
MANKRDLTEADIRSKYITPALTAAGWDLHKQIREEQYFTDGRIRVRGSVAKRDTGKKADYILYYKRGIPLAVIEAKDNKHAVGAGLQQGLDYGEILDIPFVYSSNGDGFVEHDRTKSEGEIIREIALEDFPSPAELWNRYAEAKGFDTEQEELVKQPYHYEQGGRTLRYYQEIAVNRTIEAIAKGLDRILLVMATGTGKTLTAFQIIWRIWKSGENKRILYLADRNILVDDPKRKYFGDLDDVVHKIQRGKVSKAHQIYFALYQAVTGNEGYEDIFREYSRDFFDLIIIDECHRGSAAADSAWREILEYFNSATHIGLTATPKETNTVSNIDYFGEPIYTYSLKQGIDDGFLAPYKVARFTIDKDAEGWRPVDGFTDKHGNLIPDREYNQKDYDRNLILEQRTKLVARKVTEFLKETDRYAKTIVFCTDIDHAERMRQELMNLNADLVAKDSRYVMRITGDEKAGKMQLDNFMDEEQSYPVIATTSKLLTTGVDIPTCKFIVLDANIGSMTEFKQIIGRGTRISEDYGKMFFTIMDFRNVTRHFADPDFDGEPVQATNFGPDDSPVPGDENNVDDTEQVNDEGEPWDDIEDQGGEIEEGEVKRFYVDNVEVKLLNQRIQYYDDDGKLVTESLKDYSRKKINEKYSSLDEFLRKWKDSEKKQAIVEELEEAGVVFEELKKDVDKDLDPFDLICHVAFEQPPLTRQERANNVKKRNYFGKYSGTAKEVLEGLLEKYEDEGLENLENMNILKLDPFNNMGTPMEIIEEFGGKDEYLKAIHEIEDELYKTA